MTAARPVPIPGPRIPPDPDSVITVQVTVTGTYDIIRSDVPGHYDLPADAPVDQILAVDQANLLDPHMAIDVVDEGGVEVTFKEVRE